MNGPIVCPRCTGPGLLDDPLGPRFTHLTACPLGRAEDSRLVADFDALRGTHPGATFTRPITDAEMQLCAALGTPHPATTTVVVDLLTPATRRRRFTKES